MCYIMDDEVKRNAEEVCEEIGISMAAAINIYLKKLGRERRIPFVVGAEKPNMGTLAAMAEVERMKADPNFGKTYDSVDEMMQELLS